MVSLPLATGILPGSPAVISFSFLHQSNMQKASLLAGLFASTVFLR